MINQSCLSERLPWKSLLIRAAALALSPALVAVAFAQGATENVSGVLSEVVVSASRLGEQSLQTIPMAISVIRADKVDDAGLGAVTDLLRLLPSVQMQSPSGGTNRIDMRGIVTTNVEVSNVQDRALVQIYLDDAPITLQSGNPNLQVYDLERVEILRGPQGTLYGAGSMAGTIRLITKPPNLTTLSADSRLLMSQTKHGGTNYAVRGTIDLPLKTDVLGARFAVFRGEDSGYIHNLTTGQDDINDAESTQGRAVLRWKAGDRLMVDVSATLAKLDRGARDWTLPILDRYAFTGVKRERVSDDFKLFNTTVTAALGSMQLISSSSYIDRAFEPVASLDYLTGKFLTGVTQESTSYFPNNLSRFTEELRLVSSNDAKIRWTGGLFFENFNRNLYQTTPTPGIDAILAGLFGIPGFNSAELYGTPTPDDIFYGTQFVDERQFAAFGELTIPLGAQFDLTAGVRYFDFRQKFDVLFTGVAGALDLNKPLTDSGIEKATGTNPRAVLAYRPSESLMIFAEAARGFRYGGVNQPVPPEFCAAALAAIGLTEAPTTFGPDSLWSYSLGEKAIVAGGRVTINTTAFWVDWRDVQNIAPIPCGYYFAINKGRVRSQGLEFESRVRFGDHLTLGVNASLTDAKAQGAIPEVQAVDGDRTPFFPKTIASVIADYAIPLQSGTLTFSSDYTYRSSSLNNFGAANPEARQIPSSKFLNASLSYETNRWSIGVFGTNLTNDRLVTAINTNHFAPFQPGDLFSLGRPRTFGVNARLSY